MSRGSPSSAGPSGSQFLFRSINQVNTGYAQRVVMNKAGNLTVSSAFFLMRPGWVCGEPHWHCGSHLLSAVMGGSQLPGEETCQHPGSQLLIQAVTVIETGEPSLLLAHLDAGVIDS